MAEVGEQSLVGLLASLPPAERVQRYRKLAAEALGRADAALDGDSRTGFLTLASGWQVLALEIEHSADFAAAANPETKPDPA